MTIKHSVKLAACIGILGTAALASDAMALNFEQCQQLPPNMYLAAIERGDCDIDIQTAAGPDEEELIPEEDRTRDRNRDGRNGGNGGNGGGQKSGGNGGRSGNGRP